MCFSSWCGNRRTLLGGEHQLDESVGLPEGAKQPLRGIEHTVIKKDGREWTRTIDLTDVNRAL